MKPKFQKINLIIVVILIMGFLAVVLIVLDILMTAEISAC